MSVEGWHFNCHSCGIHSTLGTLLDILALHDSRESVCKLVHHDFGQIIAGHARNIAVAHGVLCDQNIVSKTRGIACSRGNTNVCLRKQVSLPTTINTTPTSRKDSPYTPSKQPSSPPHSQGTPANPYPQTNSGGSSQSPSPPPSAPAPQTPSRASNRA